jgi:putative RecB family exonuclease
VIAPLIESSGSEKLAALTESVSASRLNLWQQCRLKFYFRHVLGIKKPRTAPLHLGTSVHETLRQWNKARWRGDPLTLKQLHDVFRTAWAAQEDDPVDWENEEDAQKATGWRLLETYFRESPIAPDEKPEAVEVTVEADLSRHGLPRLVGILDLVRSGGTIVDFKTSGQTPVPEKAAHQHETQTTAYGLLYREATGSVEAGIELHHLVKLKNPKLVVTSVGPVSEGQKSRLFRIIDSYLNGLDREDYLPAPGMQCSGCEFFNECRAWTGS